MARGRKRQSSTDEPKEAEICYKKGEFVAVLAEETPFYLCLLLENVRKNQEGFKIRWYDQAVGNTYKQGYKATTDFNCILTNLKVSRKDNIKEVDLNPEDIDKVHALLRLSKEHSDQDVVEPILISSDQLSNSESAPIKKKRRRKTKAEKTGEKLKMKEENVKDEPELVEDVDDNVTENGHEEVDTVVEEPEEEEDEYRDAKEPDDEFKDAQNVAIDEPDTAEAVKSNGKEKKKDKSRKKKDKEKDRDKKDKKNKEKKDKDKDRDKDKKEKKKKREKKHRDKDKKDKKEKKEKKRRKKKEKAEAAGEERKELPEDEGALNNNSQESVEVKNESSLFNDVYEFDDEFEEMNVLIPLDRLSISTASSKTQIDNDEINASQLLPDHLFTNGHHNDKDNHVDSLVTNGINNVLDSVVKHEPPQSIQQPEVVPNHQPFSPSPISTTKANEASLPVADKEFLEYFDLSKTVCNRNDSKILIHFAKKGDKSVFEKELKDIQFEPRFIVCQSEDVRKDAIHMAISCANFDIIPQMISILQCQTPLRSLINLNEPDSELQKIDFYKDCKENDFQQRMDGYARFVLKNITSQFNFEKCLQIFGRETFEKNFVVALRNGNPAAVEYLYSLDSVEQLPKDVCARFGLTKLHLAAITPELTALSTLIYTHRNELYLVDKDGWLPVHYAAANKSYEALSTLLMHQCKINVRTSDGETCLHIASKLNRCSSVKAILEHEASSLTVFNNQGFSPLHGACRKGHVKVVKKILRHMTEEGIEFRTHESHGCLTPLMIASKFGHSELVQYLINVKADLCQMDFHGRTALTHAIMNGHSEISQVLYAKNNDIVNLVDYYGNNLYHYALGFGWPFCYEFLLSRTHRNISDLNFSESTAVYFALMKGYFGLLEDLLRKSVITVNAVINESKQTLSLACFSLPPSEELLEFFEKLCEKYHCDVNAVDFQQNNIFHHFIDWEAKYQNTGCDHIILQMFKLLTKFKVNPWQANSRSIVPVVASLSSWCELSFKNFVLDLNKSSKFSTHLSSAPISANSPANDLKTNLLNYIIFHFLDILNIDEPTKTFGNEVEILFKENENFANLIKAWAYHTTENGDLPIEFFVRSVSVLMERSPLSSQKQTLIYSTNFFCFLLKLYENSFLQENNLLHFAVHYGCPFIVEIICKKAIDPKKLNSESLSPLSVAVQHGRIDNVRKLSENYDIFSNEPNMKLLNIFLAIENDACDSFEYALILAELNKKNGKIEALEQVGMNGNCLYHLCCMYPHRKMAVELVKLLLSCDIHFSLLNHSGESLLHLGFKNSFHRYFSPTIISCLMERIPDLGSLDQTGRSAIHHIFNNDSSSEALDFLQSINRSLLTKLSTHKDFQGETLLHYAIRHENIKAVYFLKSILTDNHSLSDELRFSVRVESRECSQMFIDKSFMNQDNIQETLVRICQLEWTDIVKKIANSCENVSSLTTLICSLLKANGLKMVNYLLENRHFANQLSLSCKQTILLTYSENITFETAREEHNKFLDLFSTAAIYARERSQLLLGAMKNFNQVFAFRIRKFVDLEEFVFSTSQQPLVALFSQFFQLPNIPFELFQYFIDLTLHFTTDFNVLLFQAKMQERSECPPKFVHSSLVKEESFNTLVKYSPLILAVIKDDIKIVRHLLHLEKNGQFLVNTNFCDSLVRSPLFHAVYNNNFEMIKLLYDRNYGVDGSPSYTGINILSQNKLGKTVFHILFDSFQVGHYHEARAIYKFLFDIVNDRNYNEGKHLFEDLLQHYKDRVPNLDLRNRKLLSKPYHSGHNMTIRFQTDLEQYLKDFHLEKITESLYLPNILTDEGTLTPFEAVITLNEEFNGHKWKIFTLIRLAIVEEKYRFTKIKGQIGSQGRESKLYFSDRKAAIKHYCAEFYSLTGEEWNEHCLLRENKRTISIGPSRMISLNMFDFATEIDNSLVSLFPSELPVIFRTIVDHYSKVFYRRGQDIEFLNSKMLHEANNILDQILEHFRTDRIEDIDSNQLNELSDEYFSCIHVDKTSTEKIKLISDLCDVYEQYKKIDELSKLIFHREFLYCSLKQPRQLQYFADTFEYTIDSLLENTQDFKYVQAVIEQSVQKRFSYDINWIMKMNSHRNFEFGKRMFFWHKVHRDELLQLFVHGVQTKPIYNHKWEIVFKAIKMTCTLEVTKPDVYWVLCQVCVDRDEILICGDHKISLKDLTSNKKFLVEQPMDSKSFFNFNDITFPITSRPSSDCYSLSAGATIPVYLVSLNSRTFQL